jgi:hypothetical protein
MRHTVRLEGQQARKRALLERRLAGRDPTALGLPEVVRDAHLMGSLELAGVALSWESIRSPAPPEEARRLRRALEAVSPERPFGISALLAWHAALEGGDGVLRSADRSRPLPPPPAPGAFVRSRLEILEQWIAAPSGAELDPSARAALVMARIVEILPFDRMNGRVARLAASHQLARAGLGLPVLVAGDAPRIEASLQAAFRLDTRPLGELLREASERGLDVMLQSLAGEPG